MASQDTSNAGASRVGDRLMDLLPPTLRDPERRRFVERLRERGSRGGVIAPHRAMARIKPTWWLLLDLIVLPAILSVAVFDSLSWLLEKWGWALEALRSALHLPGTVQILVVDLAPFLSVPIPHLTAEAAWPSTGALYTGWGVTAVFAIVGMLLRGRWLPLGYLLRSLAIIQLSSQVFFSLSAPPFPYALSVYHAGFLACGVVVLLLIPFLVGATFFVFPFTLLRKGLLSILLLLHLAVLFPLQSVIHVYWIHHGSFLSMPVLFLVFGLLLDIFVYVALYGWGMSWRTKSELADMKLARARKKSGLPPVMPYAGTPAKGSIAIERAQARERGRGK